MAVNAFDWLFHVLSSVKIFGHLKLCLTDMIHNFKWIKSISQDNQIIQKFEMAATTILIDKSFKYRYDEKHIMFFIFVKLSNYSENNGFTWSWDFKKMCVFHLLFLNDRKIQDGRYSVQGQTINCYYSRQKQNRFMILVSTVSFFQNYVIKTYFRHCVVINSKMVAILQGQTINIYIDRI